MIIYRFSVFTNSNNPYSILVEDMLIRLKVERHWKVKFLCNYVSLMEDWVYDEKREWKPITINEGLHKLFWNVKS